MWILDSDGDFLQGKRVWLKPGKRYLFGRVKKDGVSVAIDHKTISRKHFVIEVHKVNSGDGSHLHVRSKVTITDEKSKGGTHLDGHLLKAETQELTKTEHSIKPGSYPHKLRLKWNPVVLTFQFSPKEMKSGDPLKPKRERLEELDIKTVIPYISNKTTHVVAGKRNTVKGLQALIGGSYIVDDSYVDALVHATNPTDLEEEENLSLLEIDFDLSWPRAMDHLPPPGKEPTSRPGHTYEPDPDRGQIFDGWTFVFGESGQYENILPAITSGHGKALLCKVENGITEATDIVHYMRNAAGEKGFGDFRKMADRGGVLLVRWHGKGEWENWVDNIINEVSRMLDQRPVDQSEFLDAILGNDPFSLRRALDLPSTIDGNVAPPPTAASFMTTRPPLSSPPRQTSPSQPGVPQTIAGESEEVSENPPPKRVRVRTAPISRFKAFDDGFNIDSVSPFVPEDDEDSRLPQPQESGNEVEAFSAEGSVSPIEDEGDQVRGGREGSLKRPHPHSDSEDDMANDLFPAATAMKRRKLEEENKGKGLGTAPREPLKKVQSLMKKAKKPKKEIDVREAAKEHREAEEEAARLERENLQKGLGDVGDNRPAKLAVVVQVDIPVRSGRPSRANGERSDRWEEKWNGRKNFKRFRRQSVANGRRVHTQHVIVPLVEVKQNTYGIGDQYWGSNGTKRTESARNSTSQSQTPGHTQTRKEPESDEHVSTATTRLQQEAAEIVGEIDADSPRRTRLADKTLSQKTRGKRPASSMASGGAKRQKTIPLRKASESDSDDLKFRFGRRRKA